MDLKKTNAPVNTITYNKTVIEEPTGNVWSDNHWLKELIKSILKLKKIDRKTRRVCYV
jgi:hypothetical protein